MGSSGVKLGQMGSSRVMCGQEGPNVVKLREIFGVSLGKGLIERGD
jgi:hypothetical protein